MTRFQDFGESAYRELRGRGQVDLEEVDSGSGLFSVGAIRRRDLGAVVQHLKRLVRAHNLEAEVELVREDGRVV